MDWKRYGLDKKGMLMKTFEQLCEEYDNVNMLKRGGQKMVFSAMSREWGQCVIKLYFAEKNPRSDREIEIEKNIDSPMVPKIFDTGVVEYETVETMYVIEEKIEGTELRDILDDGKIFSLREAVHFLEQGLKFIAYIEKKGIVHRDIKPENIVMNTSGDIFFLDFGIARIIGANSLTKTDALLGPHTPGYAAPEQFNNLKKEIDSRTDLFSLGVVTYECLTGKNPFRENAENALEVLQKTETITPVSYSIEGDTQKQFMALLSSMMGKYPSRRPKTAEQALGWLDAAKSTFVY